MPCSQHLDNPHPGQFASSQRGLKGEFAPGLGNGYHNRRSLRLALLFGQHAPTPESRGRFQTAVVSFQPRVLLFFKAAQSREFAEPLPRRDEPGLCRRGKAIAALSLRRSRPSSKRWATGFSRNKQGCILPRALRRASNATCGGPLKRRDITSYPRAMCVHTSYPARNHLTTEHRGGLEKGHQVSRRKCRSLAVGQAGCGEPPQLRHWLSAHRLRASRRQKSFVAHDEEKEKKMVRGGRLRRCETEPSTRTPSTSRKAAA